MHLLMQSQMGGIIVENRHRVIDKSLAHAPSHRHSRVRGIGSKTAIPRFVLLSLSNGPKDVRCLPPT
jgi:hypothetical protein